MPGFPAGERPDCAKPGQFSGWRQPVVRFPVKRRHSPKIR
jgi:hypothetical protein